MYPFSAFLWKKHPIYFTITYNAYANEHLRWFKKENALEEVLETGIELNLFLTLW